MAPTLIASKLIECEKNIANNTCVKVIVHDTRGKAVSGMVVYLEPLAGQKIMTSTEVASVSQHKNTFSPYITVAQTQKQVNFVNQDSITHQIYSTDKKNKFAFKIRAGKEYQLKKIDQEAEIAMGCNIHDWMSGYLLIVDTPYFGKTDSSGKINFSLTEPGLYRVTIWHPQLPTNNNRMIKNHDITNNNKIIFSLPKNIKNVPTQENNNDIDFSFDY